ncbi:MAG: hypothetical protein HY749_02000 [Gammaproteobacteria bacterium]|nr:hypothetical protein [Gammaproteobacteria bacterium]
MTDTLEAALAVLRADLDTARVDAASQAHYEHWAKLDIWRARAEALPLLIGEDPASYAPPAPETARGAAHARLWAAFTAATGNPDPEAAVTPFALRRFAQEHGLALPLGLSRLLDFIALVLPAQSGEGSAAAERAVALAEDRETTLGAALYLVTRQAGDCLDGEGYYDAARIVDLIRTRAVFWWPLAQPTLSREQMIELLVKWLPGATR